MRGKNGLGRDQPINWTTLVAAVLIALAVVGALFWIKGSLQTVSHHSPAVLTPPTR